MGFIDRLFDVLSRGQYAAAEGLRRSQEAVSQGDNMPLDELISGAWSGLQGRSKTSFEDVLSEGGASDGVSKWGGLAGDIVLDPANVIPVGIASKLAKTAAGLNQTAEGARLIKQLGETGKAVGGPNHLPPITQERAFNKLASAQRGVPEEKMREIQEIFPGGEFPWVAEHLGDITHRMAEAPTRATFGYDNVSNKVNKTLQSLESKYGFDREFRENLDSWVGHMQDKFGIESYDELEAEVLKRAKAYADAHRQLPVYNDMQHIAREAAVALGERRDKDAARLLRALQRQLKDPETWKKEAGAFEPNKVYDSASLNNAIMRRLGIE